MSANEPITRVAGVHHTGVSTRNIDRLVRFYTEMFGFKEVERLEWKGRDDVDAVQGLRDSAGVTVMLRCGDTRLELFQYDHPDAEWSEHERPVSNAGFNHICLAVDDVSDAYQRLAAAGMPFHSPPTDLGDGRPLTYGRDPDGNVIEIWQVGMTEV